VYQINLAIIEAPANRKDVSIDPVDENRYGVDLYKNGILIVKILFSDPTIPKPDYMHSNR